MNPLARHVMHLVGAQDCRKLAHGGSWQDLGARTSRGGGASPELKWSANPKAITIERSPDGTLLYKTQDNTNAGAKVWQTDAATFHGQALGLVKVDQLLFESYRPQPARSSCRWCGSKVMRRSDGRWGTVRRSAVEPYRCGELDLTIDPPRPGFHEPVAGDNGQRLSHINYSTLLVFRKDAP